MNHHPHRSGPWPLLIVLSGFAVALLAGRMLLTGRPLFLFLLWNLFLAWVPYLVAVALAAAHRRGRSNLTLIAWGVPWLAFLPNAPYIVTDLIHLRQRDVPLAYDAALTGTFAVAGLALGLASLLLVHRVVAERAGPGWGWTTALAVVALNVVGVYIGRVHRFNSWDIIADPLGLVAVMAGWFLDPAIDQHLLLLVVGGTVGLAALYAGVWNATCRPADRHPRHLTAPGGGAAR